jgi:hypothetical protein
MEQENTLLNAYQAMGVAFNQIADEFGKFPNWIESQTEKVDSILADQKTLGDKFEEMETRQLKMEEELKNLKVFVEDKLGSQLKKANYNSFQKTKNHNHKGSLNWLFNDDGELPLIPEMKASEFIGADDSVLDPILQHYNLPLDLEIGAKRMQILLYLGHY